jgi:hypothetical protein
MSKNNALQALLFNARLICLVKFKAVESKLTASNPSVQKLHKEYYSLFAHFSNPKFWSQDITLIPGKLSPLILEVDAADPAATTDYLVKAQKLYDFLKKDLLKSAIAGVGSTSTSTWNLKMLNALRIVLQQEDGREAFFKKQGTNLDQHQEYQEMKSRHLQLMATYSELLTSNAVTATEKKVENVKKRGNNIEQSTQLSVYFDHYQKLSEYINTQITDVSLLDFFVEPPTDNNELVLQEFSRLLVKLDMKIGELAANGKDITKEADFPALSATQYDLQQSIRKALLSNELDLTEEDAGEFKKIASTLPNISVQATLKEKYQATNTLMQGYVDTLA